mmetsp:Transcript_20384/g.30070  ORF Transcript_20384/g.30070 Transcript_20384/m.30070 type:complete len:703 (+) Transcript_20384:135-2243(+)
MSKLSIGNLYFKIFGPTTVHLEHEMSLVITTSFLTSASLISLYRLSFPTPGDLLYIWIAILWLGRHLLHRFISTTDIATSLSPWYQKLRWVWIALTSGGQYFDMPISIWANLMGNRGVNVNAAVDVDVPVVVSSMGMGEASYVEPSLHRIFIVQRIVLPPFVALWAILAFIRNKIRPAKKVEIDFLGSNIGGGGSGSGSGNGSGIGRRSSLTHKGKNKHSQQQHNNNTSNAVNSSLDSSSQESNSTSFGHIYMRCKMKLNRKLDVWWRYVPHCQLMLNLLALWGVFWVFQQYTKMQTQTLSGNQNWLGAYYGMSRSKNPRTSMINSDGTGGFGGSNGGNVEETNEYDLGLNSDVLVHKFEMLQGAHAGEALKAKEFMYGPFGMLAMITVWGITMSILLYRRIVLPLPDLIAGGSIATGHGRGGSKSKTKKMDDNHMAWSEQSKSISNENRFSLYFKVILVRVLEYTVVCAILPRTEYVCKATGHCSIDTLVSENGNPTAIDSSGRNMFDTLLNDRLLGFVIIAAVVFSSTVILISQAITLDKSQLALKGFLRNDDISSGLSGSSSNSNSNSNSNKRSGKKTSTNSEITFDYGNKKDQDQNYGWSKITSIHEKWKKYAYEIFSNELGALTTSRILSICANAHLGFCIFVTIIWMVYIVLGKEWYALVLIYIALFASALEIGFLDRNVLENIAIEISTTQKNAY